MQLLYPPVNSGISKNILLGVRKIASVQSVDILDEAERKEWESFNSNQRRREYLSTRVLLREMAIHRDINPDAFKVNKNKLGQPFGQLQGRIIHLSIAHTDVWVLCTMSATKRVGVDMEPRERAVPQRLRERIVNVEESGLLKNEPTMRIWTIKEALVKLKGTGMRTNLNRCIITSQCKHLFTIKSPNDNEAHVCSFHHQSHWIALAWYLNEEDQ